MRADESRNLLGYTPAIQIFKLQQVIPKSRPQHHILPQLIIIALQPELNIRKHYLPSNIKLPSHLIPQLHEFSNRPAELRERIFRHLGIPNIPLPFVITIKTRIVFNFINDYPVITDNQTIILCNALLSPQIDIPRHEYWSVSILIKLPVVFTFPRMSFFLYR